MSLRTVWREMFSKRRILIICSMAVNVRVGFKGSSKGEVTFEDYGEVVFCPEKV